MARKVTRATSATILEILPNFCWVTTLDILLMLEQLEEFEDISENCVKVTIGNLRRQGLIDYKKKYIPPQWRGMSKGRSLIYHYKAKEV